MAVKEIQSHNEFIEQAGDFERAYLLLYKKGSEQSECSLKSLNEVAVNKDEVPVFMADVSIVRDIHPEYGITTVPALLAFEKGKFTNVVKGCHDRDYYTSLFENALYAAKAKDKPQKTVTVYTTPTCTWCNTLKSHLRKYAIRYNEVDVANDMNAAEEMRRKSGQMGVPQTDIEGEMIVGFDKSKINRLLGIEQN